MSDWVHQDTLGIPDAVQVKEGVIGIDIGGSLAKVAYIHRHSDQGDGTKTFVELRTFDNRHIKKLVDFLVSLKNNLTGNEIKLIGTGGVLKRHEAEITEKMGISIDMVDGIEFNAAVQAVMFMMKYLRDEEVLHPACFSLPNSKCFPFVLATIGTGMSMLKVDESGKYEFVAGSTNWGRTFWALGKLLTQAKSFTELIALAAAGDNRVLDEYTEDFLGDDSYADLPPDFLISSFGKIIGGNGIDSLQETEIKKEDIARSLLVYFANTIGQICSLNMHNTDANTIYYCGSLISSHDVVMQEIAKATIIWSKQTIVPRFLKHGAYNSAIGCLLNKAL